LIYLKKLTYSIVSKLIVNEFVIIRSAVQIRSPAPMFSITYKIRIIDPVISYLFFEANPKPSRYFQLVTDHMIPLPVRY